MERSYARQLLLISLVIFFMWYRLIEGFCLASTHRGEQILINSRQALKSIALEGNTGVRLLTKRLHRGHSSSQTEAARYITKLFLAR